MKKVFQTKNNNNFYYLKELQWSNQAMKLNPFNQIIKNQNNIQNINPANYIKEKSWNKRFIYNKIQNYDSAKDRNFIASISKNDDMNCYHNALKKNDIIIKNYYTNNKNKKKAVEYNKTNIRVSLNPMGQNLKKAKIINNSFSNNNINFKNNRLFSSDFIQKKNQINEFSKFLGNNPNSPDKLNRIWNDLCILEPYRELFSILITQLSDKNKEDFCEREFNELYELKTNLQLLSTSVYYRNKIIENLNYLNDKLGIMLRSKQTVSNEVILKKMSKKIENLREHTVNICFLMQKIKMTINHSHPWGKYNLDAIAEKYKFDKNYLIKMKEEMIVLKEGYAKYFFDISDDSNPFLLNASEPVDKKNKSKDPFFHYVPISNEMRDNINQCIYIIYQELIGYQNCNVSENNFRNISPLKKYKYTDIDIQLYKKHNESLNSSISNSIFNLSNNNIKPRRSGVISPSRTNYSGIPKSSYFGGDKITNSININNKRILSGNEKDNTNFNKLLYKMDKFSNDIEDKTTNYNNNDIKDIILDKNNMNIEIDINNKKNEINSRENSKENIKENEKVQEKEDINNKKEELEKFNDMNINNISNIQKEENNNTKSEKDEFEFNNNEINNKDMVEKKSNLNNNEINEEQEKENGNNLIVKNINNNLEEIVEEEKMKTESNKNNTERKNKDEEINNNHNIENEIINKDNENENDNISNKITNNINENDNIDNNNINIINDYNDNDNIENNNEDNDNNIDALKDLNTIQPNKNEKNEEDEFFVGSIEEDNNNKTEDLEKQIKGNSKDSDNQNNQSNKSFPIVKPKNLRISVFDDDIALFFKDFYISYYSTIPEVIKKMFKIEETIMQNILCGISPYMLLIYNNISNSYAPMNWIDLKNNIIGLCIFSFEYKNGIIKLNVNHLSTTNILKEANNINNYIEPKTIEQFKHIFNIIIDYIKKNFYFDEIVIGYNSTETNEEILNIFLNDLNFVIINENDELEEERNINKDDNKEKNIEQYNKMVYANDSTKNRVNDLIRQSMQKYVGKNILDIFDLVLITNNSEFISLDKGKKSEGNLVNNILVKYLLDKKERSNVNRIYNKISNLDQLIKLFQNNNINNNKELPLSLAENRFDILCTVINKTIFNNYFSNTSFFSNYSNNGSNSFLDKNTGIFYNFIKAKKILILENEKFNIKFCHILNNNLSIFFCKINGEFNKYLNKNNIYTQINNVYKETLLLNKKHVLDNKIIWIPCFEIYKHLKTLSNNSAGTIHEYIKISNQIINQTNREFLRINANNNINSENCFIKIEPDLSKDFILDNDFIFGIINNVEILNEKIFEKEKIEENKGNTDEENISEDIEGEEDNKDQPYVIFLSNIKKNDFIVNNI